MKNDRFAIDFAKFFLNGTLGHLTNHKIRRTITLSIKMFFTDYIKLSFTCGFRVKCGEIHQILSGNS